MRRLFLFVAAGSPAITPATLPSAAQAQSADDVAELCEVLSEQGRYESLGACVSEIRNLPLRSCQNIRDFIGFPVFIDDPDTDIPKLVHSQGYCVSFLVRHGGGR